MLRSWSGGCSGVLLRLSELRELLPNPCNVPVRCHCNVQRCVDAAREPVGLQEHKFDMRLPSSSVSRVLCSYEVSTALRLSLRMGFFFVLGEWEILFPE